MQKQVRRINQLTSEGRAGEWSGTVCGAVSAVLVCSGGAGSGLDTEAVDLRVSPLYQPQLCQQALRSHRKDHMMETSHKNLVFLKGGQALLVQSMYSLAIWVQVRVESVLLRNERRKLRSFSNQTRMPSGHLFGEVLSACPTGRRPCSRTRTC